MSEDIENYLKSIDNKLNWLLRLRVKEYFDDDSTNKEKVKTLYKMGFDNDEMAELIDTSEGSIRGTLSNLRSDGEIE